MRKHPHRTFNIPTFNFPTQDTMKEALQNEIKATFEDLHQVLASFTQAEFNRVPYKDSWTAGQVAEHITRSCGGVGEICSWESTDTTRAIDHFSQPIREMFLDFSLNMQSPLEIRPTASSHQRQQSLDSIERLGQQLLELAGTTNLAKTCIAFELPGFGYLTHYEWIDFAQVHARRHTHQLKKIRAALRTVEK